MSGVDVLTRGEVLESALRAREHLVTCGVPAALTARDPRLWGRRRVEQGALSWLDLPETSRQLLPRLDDLVAEAKDAGLDHVALVAVGAEAHAPLALAEGTRDAITILDGTESGALDTVLARLERTLVVISSKRGVSLEGDAYRRVLEHEMRALGMTDADISARFLVVTDHHSPLDAFARGCGYRIGLTDPALPGHFGALSAYGVVPALLAGADVATALDDAAAALPALAVNEDNPGLLLGAVLGGCAAQLADGLPRDKFVLRGTVPESPLAAWVTQLVATSTSRQGHGVLAVEPAGRPGRAACPDLHVVALNPSSAADADTSVWGSPGAQVLLWEYAAATAGWLMGANPFAGHGQQTWESEDEAAAILRAAGAGPVPGEPPAFSDGTVEVYTDSGIRDLAEVADLLTALPAGGYIGLVSHVGGDFPTDMLAAGLARRARRPVSFGTGPGWLQGTGAYHKAGPGGGAFLVVTARPRVDRRVPGRRYTLGTLRRARALADLNALRRRGLPAAWVHLDDPAAGAGALLSAMT